MNEENNGEEMYDPPENKFDIKELFNTVINEMSNKADLLKKSYNDFEEINLLELKLAQELFFTYKLLFILKFIFN